MTTESGPIVETCRDAMVHKLPDVGGGPRTPDSARLRCEGSTRAGRPTPTETPARVSWRAAESDFLRRPHRRARFRPHCTEATYPDRSLSANLYTVQFTATYTSRASSGVLFRPRIRRVEAIFSPTARLAPPPPTSSLQSTCSPDATSLAYFI